MKEINEHTHRLLQSSFIYDDMFKLIVGFIFIVWDLYLCTRGGS